MKIINGEVTKSSEVLDGIEVAQASNESEEKLKKWKYLDKLKSVMSIDDNCAN